MGVRRTPRFPVAWNSCVSTAAAVAVDAGRARDDLLPATDLVGLEKLNLQSVRPSKQPLPFPTYPSLRRLYIDGSPAFGRLLENPSVTELRIERAPGPDLSFAAAMPNLECLFIGSSPRITSLNGIELFDDLQEVELAYLPKLATLAGVASASRLTNLDVTTCKAIVSLDDVAACSALRQLAIDNCGDIASLKPIRGLNHLESFFRRIHPNTRRRPEPAPRTAIRKLGMQSRREYQPSVLEVKRQLNIT